MRVLLAAAETDAAAVRARAGLAWHGPTQCVWEAAEVARLVTCALTRGGPVPEDLIELWNWFAAGHWPSSFAREEDDRPADKFLVYPRGLLVY